MSILVALQGGTTHDVTITESVTASNSQITIAVFVGVLADALSSVSSQTSTFDAVGLRTETLTAAHSQVGTYDTSVTITETVAATASETASLLAQGLRTEAVTADTSEDAETSKDVEITESVAASESESSIFTTNQETIESLAANESEVASAEVVGLINESAGASESSVSVVEFTANLTETIEAMESNDGQIEGAAQVFDVELAESLSANDLSVAFTTSAPVSVPSTGGVSIGGGYAPPPRWRPVPVRRPIPPPLTYRRSASLRDRVFAADLAIAFSVTVGNVSESLNAKDFQSAGVVVGNRLAESVSARSEVNSSCEFACIITESVTISDYAEAELIPWILETIEVDGATLYLHNNATISLDLEVGTTIDVTVSKGETSGVLEIPIYELV